MHLEKRFSGSLSSPFLRRSFRRSEWVDLQKTEGNRQPSRTSTHPEPTNPQPYYNPVRKRQIKVTDLLCNNNFISVKRPVQTPCQLFKNQDSVAHLAEDNLWGEILGRATQRPRATLDPLGKTKICHLKQSWCRRSCYISVPRYEYSWSM